MRYKSREARFSNRVLLNYAATALPETLAIRAAANGVTEILLYDEIGWFGISAKDFVLALVAAGDGPIHVRINSPGGDVFEGMAIYNALKARSAPVTVTVDGIAASAASFIAMAGSTLSMCETSLLMVHNAWGFVIGNRHDMLETAAIMEKIDGQLAAIYAAKCGQSAGEMSTMMDAETWFTADEAKAAGMCDAVVTPVKSDAQASMRTLARAGLAATAQGQFVVDPPAVEISEPEKTEAPPFVPDIAAMTARNRRLRLAEAEVA
jgi:ATP-dependent Clp endopeptidase proteolytic subunit ClpP